MTAARQGIRTILTDTYELHGWSIPNYIVEYETEILADHISRPAWRPKESYAEQFFQIRTRRQALEFANTCFFTRSVFPELGERRGITSNYYVQLGQTSYDYVLDSSSVPSPTIQTMRDHFEFLAEAAYTAIRHYGDFRSMWD
jgi:hypothetical protein